MYSQKLKWMLLEEGTLAPTNLGIIEAMDSHAHFATHLVIRWKISGKTLQTRRMKIKTMLHPKRSVLIVVIVV